MALMMSWYLTMPRIYSCFSESATVRNKKIKYRSKLSGILLTRLDTTFLLILFQRDRAF